MRNLSLIKSSIFLIFTLFLFNLIYSQENKNVQQAENLFSQKKFFESSSFYKKATLDDRIDPSSNGEIFKHAIESLIKSNQFYDAVAVFDQYSISDKYSFDDAYNHILLLLYVGDLLHAKNIMSKSIVTENTDVRKERLQQYIDQFNLNPLEKGEGYKFDYDFYKSFYSEHAIELYKSVGKLIKNKTLIKESPWLEITEDFYSHYIYNEGKSKYLKNKRLKGKKHQGAAFYDSIGEVWYYSRTINKKSDPLSAGLFFYNQKTKKEESFVYNRPDHFLAYPSLSDSRQVLWFSSNREGGIGGLDIWYCVKDQLGWGEPINAGPIINTEKDEAFPFEKAGHLYFASNGHSILGGMDLYHVGIEGVEAKTVLAVNTPIFPKEVDGVTSTDVNFEYDPTLAGTAKMEFVNSQNQYLFDYLAYEKSGKFVKKYTLKKGKPDAIILNEKIELFAAVKDKETGKDIKGNAVEIIDVATGDSVKIVSDSTGNIKTELDRNKEYQVSTGKEGYDPVMTKIDTKAKVNEVTKDLAIRKTPSSPMVRMENILYNFNQFNLSNTGLAELDTLAEFLKMNPDVKIDLSSHTDSRGTNEYNNKLSGLRGKSCYDYLTKKGVKKESLIMKNFGETKLLNQCKDGVECGEDLHEVNRRTEFVLKFSKEFKIN
jgi:outer membrane protein OmpA-like peptidoglycan-associated protein